MDSETCWNTLLNAIEAERLAEASEIADDLFTWLLKGGFPPTITNPLRSTS